MTTARDVIKRSLRLLGQIDPEEDITSSQADTGLQALNAMVHGWKGQGVDVGHEDWTLDDDVTVEIDPMHLNALASLLAVDLIAEYPSAQLPPATAQMAVQSWAALQAAYFDSSVDSDLVVDTTLRRLQADRRWRWLP